MGIFLAVLAAPVANAQRCAGNTRVGCLRAGAVCSPVTTGTGTSGRCRTTPGLPIGERECECAGAPALNLNGTWLGNDGAVYFLRQIGNELWWAGFSVESPAGLSDLHKGLRFTNVFHGQISGNTVSGEWADVPRGTNLNSGTLSLTAAAQQIQRQAATGGFGATQWNRTSPAPPAQDIFSTFDQVKKNQNAWHDHSLLDNLKPAKAKPVAIFGSIAREDDDLDSMHVNYNTRNGRSYHDFICLNDNDSPPDGDIDFGIKVDRSNLDAQLGFWTDGWETGHSITPSNFFAKLARQNKLHVESIMFGGTKECGDDGTPSFLLPGWQQAGAAGVLVNGLPIAGQMNLIDRDLTSARITAILGRPIPFDARVRVTGNLVLDCGHGFTHPCDEDDAGTQNQEIHPVYALDFVQNFRLPRLLATLTGVWSSNDAGTYYVRELGNTVWWLGLSVDEGRSFANVFRGTLQNGQISGTWADVPLGETSGNGALTVSSGAGGQSTAWTRLNVTGGFSGSTWAKLYDVAENRVVVVFEKAVLSGLSWPSAAEPFEFAVNGQRVEAQAANPRSVRAPGGQQGMQADLTARIPVSVSASGVPIAVSFAGYRATWTISESNLKPGNYTQSMKPPRALPAMANEQNRSEVMDRDAAMARPSDSESPLRPSPAMTLHYRIETPGGPQ